MPSSASSTPRQDTRDRFGEDELGSCSYLDAGLRGERNEGPRHLDEPRPDSEVRAASLPSKARDDLSW